MKRRTFIREIVLLSAAPLLLLPRKSTAQPGWSPVHLAALNYQASSAGGGAITFVSAGAAGPAASGNAVPGMPSGVSAGDILICVAHTGEQTAMSMSGDWTEIVQANGGGTSSRMAIFYCRYSGSAPDCTVNSSTASTIIAGIAAFRGCVASGSPVDVLGSTTAGTTATIAHAGITVISGTLLLAINGAGNDSSRTNISGWSSAFESGGNNAYLTTLGFPDGSIAISYKAITAGSTGTVNQTQSLTVNNCSVLVSLKP